MSTDDGIDRIPKDIEAGLAADGGHVIIPRIAARIPEQYRLPRRGGPGSSQEAGSVDPQVVGRRRIRNQVKTDAVRIDFAAAAETHGMTFAHPFKWGNLNLFPSEFDAGGMG